MSKFVVGTNAIIAARLETFDLFTQIASNADPLHPDEIRSLIDQKNCYIELTDTDKPFYPNPADKSLALRLFAHPDYQTDETKNSPDFMIGLFSHLSIGTKDDGEEYLKVTPAKLLVGPKATVMFPYMHSCCGSQSAAFSFGDAQFQRGQTQAPNVAFILRDPVTVETHHAQWFNRPDGGSFGVDSAPHSQLLHAHYHIFEQLTGQTAHTCSNHAPVTGQSGSHAHSLTPKG